MRKNEKKVISEREKVAITEKQCELINQMGLIHGGDIQQMMGMMVDMEKREIPLGSSICTIHFKGEKSFCSSHKVSFNQETGYLLENL